MMQEIPGLGWDLEVGILGVNQVGHHGSNDAACAGKDIPWLQETADHDVWSDWGVTYRDVIILDAENEPVAAYNLTTHNLSLPADYEALKALLEAAANP